jgi:hypothetical protein
MWHKLFGINNTPDFTDRNLFFYLDKMVNISMIHIERGEYPSIRIILHELEDLFYQIWKLKNTNFDNFSKFLSFSESPDFYMESHLSSALFGKETETFDFSKDSAGSSYQRLLFETPLQKGMFRFFYALHHLWIKALSHENEDIVKECNQVFVRIFFHMMQEPGNETYLIQLLRVFVILAQRSVQYCRSRWNSFLFSAPLVWYTQYSFAYSEDLSDRVHPEYQQWIDYYFFQIMQYIIQDNAPAIIDALIFFLIQESRMFVFRDISPRQYLSFLYRNRQFLYREWLRTHPMDNELSQLEQDIWLIDSFQEFRSWFKRHDALTEAPEKLLDEALKVSWAELKKEVLHRTHMLFRYQKLSELMFMFCAYSLYHGHVRNLSTVLYEYQRYKNNPSWLGKNILPEHLREMLYFLARKPSIEKRYQLREGRFDSSYYFHQTYLLLLAYVFHSQSKATDPSTATINRFIDQQAQRIGFSYLQNTFQEMRDIALQLSRQSYILGAAGIKVENPEQYWNLHILRFIHYAQRKIWEAVRKVKASREIDPAKAEAWVNDMTAQYKEKAILRNLFEYYGAIKTASEDSTPKYWGIKTIDDKGKFLNPWDLVQEKHPIRYGTALAYGENHHLFKQISRSCKTLFPHEWLPTLQKHPCREWIAIVSTAGFQHFFDAMSDYTPRWQESGTWVSSWPISYVGLVRSENLLVHVFRSPGLQGLRSILTLSTNHMGVLIESQNKRSSASSSVQTKPWLWEISDLSTHQEALQNLTSNPPPWLKVYGSPKEQKEFLKDKVSITISQSLVWQAGESFSGFYTLL